MTTTVDKLKLAKRFMKSIGIRNYTKIEIYLNRITRDPKKQNTYDLYFEMHSGWNYGDLETFMNAVVRSKENRYRVHFDYLPGIKDSKLNPLIGDWYFNNVHENKPFEVFFDKVQFDDPNVTFVFKSHDDIVAFQKYEEDLKNFFQSINYDLIFKCVEEKDFTSRREKAKIVKSNFAVEAIEKNNKDTRIPYAVKDELNALEPVPTDNDQLFEETKKRTEEEIAEKLEKNYNQMLEDRRRHDLFKKGDYKAVKILQIDTNSGAVDVNGAIFQVTANESRTGKFICRVGIDDGTDAIYATLISNEKSLKREDLMTIAVGQNIRIEGRVDVDRFRGDTMIMGHYFFILPPTPLRDDTSPDKRVELHLHTKMSDMDGVSFFKDYVKLAKHMGHKAIAITDHGGVQGFPDAEAVAMKEGIKVIYGSELYVIDENIHAAVNGTEIPLRDATYVCLDTETTGLSCKYDRITEVGAVKIVKGIITERLDILINPGFSIPQEIQEKTNITDEMVKDKPTFKEAYPEIAKFLMGCVLVTHNLEFDYGMINSEMIENGFGELKVPGIDTLGLSRYLFPENAYHNLGSVCKRYEVEYDDEKAHRADYDAEVLSNVWVLMRLELMKRKPMVRVIDLENLPMVQANLKYIQNDHHVIALIKDENGTKDLYKIISDAHINWMGAHSFTTLTYLNSHREHLLLGSACFNGLVFQQALLKSDEELRKAIKMFDFIEIQPLANYSFLIDTHQIPDKKRLKDIISRIISVAKEENKIIVATGDCHYRDPSDKIYRDVIISAKQIGSGFHPLNPRWRNKYPFFENPDQHYRGTDEMLKDFEWLGKDAAYEYVVTNSNKIADMCPDKLIPVKLGTFTPHIENSEKKLTDLVYFNAHNMFGDHIPDKIEDRIQSELNGIIKNGYSVIYYIAYELVKKANDDGYIVGSRGSVGSSLVATLSNITEVNPLPPYYLCPKCKHFEFYTDDPSMSGFDLPEKMCPECGTKMKSDGQSIPFQTFLGFNADKTPDIDLNFPTNYQSRAHEYTKVLLGEKNVYRAGTISAVQFKTAYGYVRKYYEDFLHVDPDSIHKSRIASIAYGCTEVKRTTGQHPAGIVVVPSEYDVTDFTPIQYPADDVTSPWKTTHFDFTSMHDTLLKLDILGHLDPQALRMMCDLTGVDIKTIPFNDKKVLSLFTSDDALKLSHKYLPVDNGALGLPEFGTDFVRQVLRESQPKTFKDLVIISGLTHGTDVWNNNAQDLIKSHTTDLKGVIGCRDDIMTYLLSMGLEPHNAFVIMETVRKKDKQLSAAQIQDMLDHHVPDYYIESCKKIKYLFPKGHATAYVMMAIRVAYFKVYYPLEYYCTFFSIRSEQYDIEAMIGGIDAIHDRLKDLYEKRVTKNPENEISVKEEAQITTLEVSLEMLERGYKFENISIEKSDASNFIIDRENKALIPPLKVIDGVGESNAKAFIEARANKPFTSKEDLAKRGGLTQTNIKALEALGALKDLKESEQISLFDFVF